MLGVEKAHFLWSNRDLESNHQQLIRAGGKEIEGFDSDILGLQEQNVHELPFEH